MKVILIIIIILFYFLLFYFFFKLFTLKKYKKSNKKKSIVVVVARYNEDLKWINTEPFNKFKYIVYNKGLNDNFEKNNVIKIINLENVGRDCHTFLYHIYNNYDNLDDITIFLPGSIDIFYKHVVAKYMLELINKYNRAFIICQPINNIFKKTIYNFTIDDYKSTNKENYNLNKISKIEKSRIRPFGKWYEKYINNKFNIKFKYSSFNCIFSVDKRDILNYSKEFYNNLINEMNYHNNHETVHYLERSWATLFNTKYTIIDNSNFFQYFGYNSVYIIDLIFY